MPSSWNWTPRTPSVSEAEAVTVTVALTEALAAGAVMATVGGVLSTVTATAAEVVVLPAASRATASDNVGVAGVKFLADGAQIGAEVTAAPYSVAWNTAGVGDGSHM